MSELVLVARDGMIATVTLNDPTHLNLFSPAMRDGLIDAFRQLNDDPDCRAIVLAAAGKDFSAGGDMKSMTEKSAMQMRARLAKGSSVLARLLVAGNKPVIAAVEGNAYGAGLSLAAAAEYVVAARTAKFCAAFLRIGLIPDVGLLWTLPRRVGRGRAMKLMALARPVDASEAERIGLVDELTEPGSALEAAKKVARDFAEMPPVATSLLKWAMSRGLEDVLRQEIDLQPVSFVSNDHAEAKAAFFEKRRPSFRGN
jgi:2-(1,2-epoxy-1,2-dihydrophenyl)acetyl-CoA isomerase